MAYLVLPFDMAVNIARTYMHEKKLIFYVFKLKDQEFKHEALV